jgi:hypothetical protein
MREGAGLAPPPPPTKQLCGTSGIVRVLGCGRWGTCRELPDRPRWQMASRYTCHHPHPQAVPQRHSNVSPRGWPDGQVGTCIRSPPNPPQAQSPCQLCASYRPGHTRRSTQYGGSDHRRPRSDSPMAAATTTCCVAVGQRRGKSLTFFCWTVVAWVLRLVLRAGWASWTATRGWR